MKLDVKFQGIILTVEGDYQPAEARVNYYKDGTGYPGCPADFDITGVWTRCGDDIMPLFSGEAIYADLCETVLIAIKEME